MQVPTFAPIDAAEARRRINLALTIAIDGQCDGAHHKAWAIDQMVRALTGCPTVKKTGTDVNGTEHEHEDVGTCADHEAFVAHARTDEDGEECGWDEGIAP